MNAVGRPVRTTQTRSAEGGGGSTAWRSALRQRFGLTEFRPGQVEVIERLMAGQSAVAVFPTGGGKSLCYQLPAGLLDGLTVVVSPLLALMREQVDELNRLGLAAARLDSTMSDAESAEVVQGLRRRTTKLLYVAPERFFNERFRGLIEGLPIALFAVDEAHCISQWGHNFRPDYLKLARVARQIGAQRVLALTATATPAVLSDICREFSIPESAAVRTSFYRSNLQLRCTLCDPAARSQTLVERLKSASAVPAIVYVTQQQTAETVAEQLQASGLDARAYHAGLLDVERHGIQDWFMGSDQAIVVATIAFGMGVNKHNIRGIYHFNPAKSIESYAQEIGRAGRDGQPAVCETLLVPEDRAALENFAHGNTPDYTAIEALVEILKRQPTEFWLSYYALAYETDMRDSVLRTLLTRLEQLEVLESIGARYASYSFKPRVDSASMLAHFQDERRRFASDVLSMTVRKRSSLELDVTATAGRLRCERDRIVRMLDYFAQQGWIELQGKGLMHGYRQLQPISDPEQLATALHGYAKDREISELARLDALFEFYLSRRCQHAALSDYFGQGLDQDCGHCSVCQGGPIQSAVEPVYPRVGDSARSSLKTLRMQYPDLLRTPYQQARFLCGLSTPRSIRARLTRQGGFGCCSSVPYSQVLEHLTTVPID